MQTTEASANIIVTETEYSYDRQGRLREVRHRMDGDSGKWVRLHSYSYDAIGRLQEESLGEADTRVYGYDVRSRLTSVEANLYRQRTDFTFGGNVSTFFWKTWENLSFGNTYRFSYDGLSRLVSARSSNEYYPSGRYDTDYQYDLNGNITSLRRVGLYTRNWYNEEYDKYTEIDHVTMEYVGNQLSRATNNSSDPFFQGAMNFEDKADEEVEYVYDGNGNTVADLNRGTTTIYDWNNRPRRIDFANGSSTAYVYDAAGVKRNTRHRIVSEWPAVPGAEPADPELFESSIDYCGPFIYEDSVLSRVNFEGGYISLMSEDGRPQREYHFFHRDHLGNNRVDVDGEGSMCQVAHYYPFGMQWGTGYRTDSQRWKFGGKELDRAAGLDLSDFEARQYDPTTGRFTSMDTHAEDYYAISGYAYCANNPLLLIDPTGEQLFFGSLPPIYTVSVTEIMISSSDPIVTTSQAGRITRVMPKIERHHIIPKSLKGNEVVKNARKEGFKFEGADNKIGVEKFNKATNTGRHGNHPKYTDYISEKLNECVKNGESPNEFLQNLTGKIRHIIETNPDVKINDLVKLLKVKINVLFAPQTVHPTDQDKTKPKSSKAIKEIEQRNRMKQH